MPYRSAYLAAKKQEKLAGPMSWWLCVCVCWIDSKCASYVYI